MLIAGWVLCAMVLAITVALGKRQWYGGVIWLQIAGFFGPPILLMSVVTSLLGLTVVLAVLAVVALSVEMQPQRFTRWAIGLTGGVLLLNTAYGWYAFQETINRREQLAFEEIEAPLPVASAGMDDASVGYSQPGIETLARLESLESDMDSEFRRGEWRSDAIRRLHENTVQQFINSPGFGVTRMSGWDSYLLETEDPGPLPQPEMPEPPYVPDNAAPDGSLIGDNLPNDEFLERLHVAGVSDFANPRRFGYRNSEGRVAGFEPHRLDELPAEAWGQNDWTLARVELVSLLKGSEPRVYQSEHLPRMDELRDAPTRSATNFEAEAIARVRDGEDLLTMHDGSQLFVVGSLRAMTKCLGCHAVKRGDVLGAFSYEFRSLNPRPKMTKPGA